MLEINTDLNLRRELEEQTVRFSNGRLTVAGKEGVISSVDAKSIKRVFVEQGLGAAKLVVQTRGGDEKEIAYFTNRRAEDFVKFERAVNASMAKRRPANAKFEERTEKTGGINTLYWLFGFSSEHRRILAVGVLLSLVMVAVSLVPPYLLKLLIDKVLLAKSFPPNLFLYLTLTLIAAYAGSILLSSVQEYVLNVGGNRIVTDLRSRLFKRAVNLGASEIDSISTARIQTRLTDDTGNTEWLMTFGISTLITNSLTIVGIGVILFALFPTLAIYILLPIPFIIVLVIKYNRVSDRVYHKNWRRDADLTSRINDVIPNYTLVKSATKEGYEGDQYDSTLKRYYDAQIDVTKMELRYWQPVGFLVAMATVMIWWFGGSGVLLGNLTLGVITAFLAYMAMFYEPIQEISTIMPFFQESITSGERLREIFEPVYGQRALRGARRPKLDRDIHMRNVWFGYDPLFPVIKGVNTTFKSGRVTTIVGKSGAGKTTLAKLLIGLYATNEGDIRFGSVGIEDIDISYLRKRVIYVPQDTSFFDNTVAYNMSYFSDKMPESPELVSVAMAIGIHDEIMKFPLCYDTRIKAAGLSLSGGQRQRLALTRAMLGNADAIILDEITSNLDMINARRVNEAIAKFEGYKTLINITHDADVIATSDYTIVLEDGGVVEQGKPLALMNKRGKLYAMMKYTFSQTRSRGVKPKGGETQESFTKRFFVDAKEVSIYKGERESFVDAAFRNENIKRLVPRRPFPVSDDGFLLFYSHDGKEVFGIKDYTNLDRESRRMVEDALGANSFAPKVTAIRELSVTGDGLRWKLVTDRGDMVFITKTRHDIMQNGGSITLVNRYNMPLRIRIGDLDRRSQRLIESTI